MSVLKIAVRGVVAGLSLALATAAAVTGGESAPPALQQPVGRRSVTVQGVQPASGATVLEIAPQAATRPSRDDAQEEVQHEFRSSHEESEAGIDFSPDSEQRNALTFKPYLGIRVKSRRLCYFTRPKRYLSLHMGGVEASAPPFESVAVRGLEVVGVDPDSPAAHAGLRARVEPHESARPWYFKLAGRRHPTREGDLIVTVDGFRVRDRAGLGEAISQLLPGAMTRIEVMRWRGKGKYEFAEVRLRVAGQPRSAIISADASQLAAAGTF